MGRGRSLWLRWGDLGSAGEICCSRYNIRTIVRSTLIPCLKPNGSEFRFIQLHKGEKPTYVLSDLLSIDRGDDLYRVAQILKYLGQQVI